MAWRAQHGLRRGAGGPQLATEDHNGGGLRRWEEAGSSLSVDKPFPCSSPWIPFKSQLLVLSWKRSGLRSQTQPTQSSLVTKKGVGNLKGKKGQTKDR